MFSWQELTLFINIEWEFGLWKVKLEGRSFWKVYVWGRSYFSLAVLKNGDVDPDSETNDPDSETNVFHYDCIISDWGENQYHHDLDFIY